MSTRYSAPAPAPVGERSTDGNRVSPSARTEQISTRNRLKREIIPHADRAAHSLFGNPDPSVRRPINGRKAVQHPDGVGCARRLKAALTARDLMSSCVATLRPEDSIERAARLMSETDSGAVPVVDGSGLLLGIITDHDITVKLIARGSSIPHAQVSDCMTTAAFACSADNSLESCVSAMSWHQVRRIPIVDDEHKVVGTISQRDLARYMCEHPEKVERRAMAEILLALAS